MVAPCSTSNWRVSSAPLVHAACSDVSPRALWRRMGGSSSLFVGPLFVGVGTGTGTGTGGGPGEIAVGASARSVSDPHWPLGGVAGGLAVPAPLPSIPVVLGRREPCDSTDPMETHDSSIGEVWRKSKSIESFVWPCGRCEPVCHSRRSSAARPLPGRDSPASLLASTAEACPPEHRSLSSTSCYITLLVG